MDSHPHRGRSRSVLFAGGALLLVLVLGYLNPDWTVTALAPVADILRGISLAPIPLGFLLASSLIVLAGAGLVRRVRAGLPDTGGAGRLAPARGSPGSQVDSAGHVVGPAVPPGALLSPTDRPGPVAPSTAGKGPPAEGESPRLPSGLSTAGPRRPTTHALGLRLLVLFAAIATPVLWASAWILAAYDRVVADLGAFLYWPQPWPGAGIGTDGIPPDFVFLMYLCGIAAYLAAIVPVDRGEFPRGTAARVVGIVGAYLGSALLLDASLDGLNLTGFWSSLHVLGQALLGGVFFAALIFATLVVPPPLPVPRPAGRDRVAVVQFLGSVAGSVAIAGTLLYLAWSHLGLGQVGLGFAILLLLPVYSLVVWGVIGLAVYRHRLNARPLPTLAEYHPPVTVIIPAYNEEENIAFAVESADLAARLYPGPTEVLVGDDGSTDRTAERAQAALERLRHASGRLLRLPHAGKSNPLNAMLREARGDILVRVDGDCRLSAETGFAPLIPHFADPEVGGVQGLLLPLQRDGWTRKLRFMEIAWNHLFLRRAQMAFRGAEVVDGAFSAFRRQDLREAGGWVEWNGEDTEITLRLLRRGFRMRLEPRAGAFEDVPENFRQLKKQRIRWNRGGIFAHMRHYGALFTGTPEFGGIAIAVWLGMFARGGMRQMIYVYAALATAVLALPTLPNLAVIVGLLFAPRAVVIAIQAARLRWWSGLAWLPIWPAGSAIKQYFATESFGTMLPGLVPELFE